MIESKDAPISWLNISVFLITGLIALIWIPIHAFTHGFTLLEVIACVLCLGYCGMSITVGYHRLWSHKTYQANSFVRFILAIGGAFALQNSILHWCSDHRNHHRYVDNNDKDPYSAKRGFWFSHIGWMLRQYQGEEYGDYKNVKDLQKDKIVMWQHKYYVPLALLTNLGIPLLLGWLNGDILSMFLMSGVLRLVLSHHFTFFINSLAHIWGKSTFSSAHTAKDNHWLSLVTYGEGYHNFHHTFEYDYRNGIHWYDFDPSKWFIKTMSLIGFTWGLRKAPQERIEQAKAKFKLEQAKDKLLALPNAAAHIEKLEQEYEVLLKRINAFYSTQKRFIDLKKKKLVKDVEKTELYRQLQDMNQQLIELKQKLKAQQNNFARLSLQYS
ncbi:fatty acid desaturase [Catenovulum sp. SM1970]|uniref:fatty acid desaturase n=1 Tax=Marinifaba aquimaris TaxID=2741323 RepID=UPI001574C9C7|nr:fatty acid desaturase [Marinifaba aquimaris]NTS78885.1 fatty acid desaturase [Marinifaba aquimaris]